MCVAYAVVLLLPLYNASHSLPFRNEVQYDTQMYIHLSKTYFKCFYNFVTVVNVQAVSLSPIDVRRMT